MQSDYEIGVRANLKRFEQLYRQKPTRSIAKYIIIYQNELEGIKK